MDSILRCFPGLVRRGLSTHPLMARLLAYKNESRACCKRGAGRRRASKVVKESLPLLLRDLGVGIVGGSTQYGNRF